MADLVAQRFAAKHLHEGLMPCPACGAEIRAWDPGWVLGSPSTLIPRIDCPRCDRTSRLVDATDLVATGRALPARTLQWLQAYVYTCESLLARLRDDFTISTCFGVFHGCRELVVDPAFEKYVRSGARREAHDVGEIDVTPFYDVIALELRTRGIARLGRIGVFRALPSVDFLFGSSLR
ncbi:MAG: hypothetical protein JO257_01900 [Deltaproteobacteria bacterium]|nr:hypothetical protein [Deltaproteobacteria bacterium]